MPGGRFAQSAARAGNHDNFSFDVIAHGVIPSIGAVLFKAAWFSCPVAFASQEEAAATGTRSNAHSRLPMLISAMTQPIGHGVPSAKSPTSAEPVMPVPYWIAPISADIEPARSGKLLSAPAIELATMNPVAEINRKSGITSPVSPPQSVHASSRSE